MKQVVYFLGAGFSAPAGIPVIKNFLFRARDQYASNSESFSHFREVFAYIDIKDVIVFHTPEFENPDSPYNHSTRSFDWLFGRNIAKKYVGFCSALLGLRFSPLNNPLGDLFLSDFSACASTNGHAHYRIVSLNYDRLIEGSIEFLNCQTGAELSLEIAKLHGSVDQEIVPPTWRKTIGGKIEQQWQNAAEWLSEANEIRILGYSLPVTDSYVKHLWSAALAESTNLQRIDVLCLDQDGTVRQRFDDLFAFPGYRFFNVNIAGYLEELANVGSSVAGTEFVRTEDKHKYFLRDLL